MFQLQFTVLSNASWESVNCLPVLFELFTVRDERLCEPRKASLNGKDCEVTNLKICIGQLANPILLSELLYLTKFESTFRIESTPGKLLALKVSLVSFIKSGRRGILTGSRLVFEFELLSSNSSGVFLSPLRGLLLRGVGFSAAADGPRKKFPGRNGNGGALAAAAPLLTSISMGGKGGALTLFNLSSIGALRGNGLAP